MCLTMFAAEPPRLVVAGAICRRGRVLIAQRPPNKELAGMWAFPGGKVETSEHPYEALARELREELNIVVTEATPLAFAAQTHGPRHLVILLYMCEAWRGEPVGFEGQNIEWVRIDDLERYEMVTADKQLIGPLRASQYAGSRAVDQT